MSLVRPKKLALVAGVLALTGAVGALGAELSLSWFEWAVDPSEELSP